jgi:ATP-dependent helicase/DNAse subunit B
VVLKLTEPEEIEETIDASVMGSVIHEVLHILYEGHENELITPDHIKIMINRVPDITNVALKKNEKFKGNYASGKNLLIAKVAQLYVVNYLKKELSVIQNDNTPLYIRLLENEFSYQHAFTDTNKADGIRKVLIKGLIDRIDQSGENLRLIDYKSGNVDDRKELKLVNPEELLTDPGKSKALQLLIYKYLIEKNPESINGSYANIEPGIISLRKFGSYIMPLNDMEAWQSQESYKDFEAVLSELFRQIYDTNTTFTATSDTERCKYCSFKAICNR